ncbi:MAG TPA: siphovirus Gp157 family protein [Stellaceae bacterium]|nr:siphovirus Gp157 family protein [Stellaceae bacterium]
MDPYPLNRELQLHELWRTRLLAEFPETDEQTLRDTLEGLTSLREILVSLVRSYLDDLTLVEALGLRIADLRKRLARYEARAQKKRGLTLSVMEQADLKQLIAPDFTVSLRRTSPPLIVTAENEIPASWWKPQPSKLDRQGLLVALRGGVAVPGVVLGNGQMTLSVRST